MQTAIEFDDESLIAAPGVILLIFTLELQLEMQEAWSPSGGLSC